MTGESGGEQNKSEEATPFKLRKARERGQVARGMDLGFVGSLAAAALFAAFAGQEFIARMVMLMRYSLARGISGEGDPLEAIGILKAVYWDAFQPLLVLGGVIVAVVVALELLQLRGVVFSAQPLKPDFSRLNPAKGLKRVFSARMLKETLKSIGKFLAYAGVAWLLIRTALDSWGPKLVDASHLVAAIEQSSARLLYAFLGLAFAIMVIDQVIVRKEFGKQMRMSRREVTREAKEREGEPRFKQKRKDIHQQMREQSAGLGKVPGSDMVIVNPEHYAIALCYDPKAMEAPQVVVKGRDHFAQLIKRKARLHAIPVLAHAALARSLHADCAQGRAIQPHHYHDVARLYRALQPTPLATADAEVS